MNRNLSASRRALTVRLAKTSLLVVMLAAPAVYGCKSTPGKAEGSEVAPVTAESGKISITVNDQGFSPSSVQAKQGQPLTLQFTRVTDKTCATQVAFPELNITKDLPLNSTVSVQVPTDQARKLTFQCGMGMYKSSVVIL